MIATETSQQGSRAFLSLGQTIQLALSFTANLHHALSVAEGITIKTLVLPFHVCPVGAPRSKAKIDTLRSWETLRIKNI